MKVQEKHNKQARRNLNLSQVLSDQDKTEIDFDFYLDEVEEFFTEDFNIELDQNGENTGVEKYLKEKMKKNVDKI
ncbi:hypothetical protein BAS10_13170 [Elizabethkingia meningoseptica]|uniref:hypothetical protein n=1 Tax=Elizabethkingia meningoseptica TaxID=238 RepID=UPI00099AB0CF|nr:hypothetical protein [Elizabethkingia meningoseptica]OPB93747.1 hypothetical protein BAS10_13170 [Elizabethkingia meningoseptica]